MITPGDINKMPILEPMSVRKALVVLFLVIELLPVISSHCADLISPALAGWDPDDVFTWLTVHHVCLFCMTIIVMALVGQGSLSDWGFNFKKWQLSLYIIVVFAVAFTLIEYLYMYGKSYPTEYPQTPINKLGMLGFQYFISGAGEEPLFRGLVIIILLGGVSTTKLSARQQYFVVISVSTLFFMYAHISVDWFGMSVTGFDFGQQTKALQLGILYAAVFIHTQSLLAPMVLHGMSNGITATIGFYIV